MDLEARDDPVQVQPEGRIFACLRARWTTASGSSPVQRDAPPESAVVIALNSTGPCEAENSTEIMIRNGKTHDALLHNWADLRIIQNVGKAHVRS